MSFQELQNIISPKFTEKVILDFIQKYSGLSDIKVQKINFGESSKKGDSYMSTICRFKIEATGKNQNEEEEKIAIPVLTKFPPKIIGRRKTFRCNDFFENEIIFYEKVWSAFQKFQEEAQIQDKFDNIPIVLSAYFDGENDYVAMYDLSTEGYTCAERGNGLDFSHTVAILQLLARFHAVSLAFKEKNPEEFEKAATSLKETYFAEKLRPWNSNFRKNVFNVIRDAVEKELPVEYLHKLDKLYQQDLYGIFIKACVVRGRLSVVTHGDVWVPNFLIKYEGEIPGKITMIDFQLARYTDLVTDLTFFLLSCVRPDLLDQKWDQLVEIYHESLVDAMKRYGAKNLVSLDEILAALKEHSVMGVGMSMEGLIMAQLEDDEVSDLDAVEGDEAVPLESVWIVHPFKVREKRQRIANMIKLAVDRNFI